MKRRQQERRRKYKRLIVGGCERNGEKVEEEGASRLFELLLGAELVGVSALALAAVGGTGRKAGL